MASSIVWADVLSQAPELTAVGDTARQDILAHVNTTLDVVGWGGDASPRLRLARIYLAAHFGSVQSLVGGGGPAGPVISESDGRLSRAYASPFNMPGFDALLDLTKYGRAYRTMLRSAFAGPRVF